MTLNNVLIIFLKYPQPGKVKTRLAKSIGQERAALLYKILAQQTLFRTKSKNYQRFIFFTPEERAVDIKNWLGNDLDFYPQGPGDLGMRMVKAFKAALGGGAKKVMIIGTDCPFIKEDTIKQAFDCLDESQCVIGPCLDGGYYLLGLKSRQDEIFKEISWETDKVYKQTVDCLRRLGLDYSELGTYFDIDTLDDLNRFKNELAENLQGKASGIQELFDSL